MCFNQGCKGIVVNKGFSPAFLYFYLLAMNPILKSRGQGTTFIELSADELESLPLTVPSPPEQKAIAKFLDEKTAEIDALISKKEELLTLLAEQRKALITQAITKGLNTNAPMKESGVLWIGDVPKEWEVKKLKFIVYLINHKTEFSKVDLPYLGLEHIEPWTGNRIGDAEASSEGIVQIYKSGDVLFGKLRPYLAKIYLADNNGACTTEVLVLRPTSELKSSFLRYFMSTEAFINEVNGSTYGTKMPRANWEFIGRMPVLLPTQREQEKIVEYIHKETAKIDALRAKNMAAVKKLKEYRTALITNAVTGKIKVV